MKFLQWRGKEMETSKLFSDFQEALGSSQMRAEETDKIDYIDRYRVRGIEDRMNPDWALFNELWNKRNESNDDMAELLAEVLGVAHDEALAWIEDY